MEEGVLTVTGQDPRIGMVLQERYQIKKLLGEGGMGAVYEGEHILIKRRVAIKCLHAQFATHSEIVARFHREALAATSIGHENIVEVTDMGRFPDGSVFMVLEYLEGRDWADDLDREGPQPIGKTVRIMEQVLDGLAAAHAKDIVHRDLKPENIFLIQRGQNPNFPKIVDFGISKFKDGSGGPSMTQTGTAMGTPYYMSPEQAQGKKDVGPLSDLYSLGVILFQALTGQFPFDDEAYPMLVLKICTEPPPSASYYRKDLPPELSAVIARCLEKDPAARYQSCEELKAALEPFRDLDGAPTIDKDARPTSSMGVGAIQSGVAMAATMHATPENSPATTTGRSAMATPAPAGSHTTPGPESIPGLQRSGSNTGRLAIVGLLVALAAVGGAFAMTQMGGQTPSAAAAPNDGSESETAASGATDEAAEAEGADVAPEPPVSPGPVPSVTVEISTEPENAEVYLDGHRIPNPFDGELPRTEEPRRLEVRAEGYVTKAQDLVLVFPQRVRIRLERGDGMDDQSTTTSERSGSRSRSRSTSSGRSTSSRSGSSTTASAPSLPPPPMVTEAPMVTVAPMVTEPAPAPTTTTTMALKRIEL